MSKKSPKITHVHFVQPGESLREGDMSTAICGFAETLQEDARWSAEKPVCPHCFNIVRRERDAYFSAIEAIDLAIDGAALVAAQSVRRAS